jgi:hypothetical protein
MLLADKGHRYEILTANAFASNDVLLQALLKATGMLQPRLEDIETYGGSLWLRVRGGAVDSA